MKTVNERLIEARLAAGYATVREAATSLGVPYPTYAAHENGTDGFKLDSAVKYARKFKVSLDWLVTGKGRGPSQHNNLAWEIYLEMADLAPADLEYIKQAVEFAKKKIA
jgi:DNA-binding XRE family transcriptional regulator